MRLALYCAEWLKLWRGPRLRWMYIVFMGLFAAAFFSAWISASRITSDRALLTESERARWIEQGDKDPHSAAHFGAWVVKPSSPLTVLDPGVEPFVGLSVWLEAHKRNEMIFRPRQDADPLMRSATSVGQLIELLGPIMAILLGFAGFAEDRERGTLRMALGNGALPAKLLATRFLVMLTALFAMVIAPAFLLGVFAIHTLPDSGWNGWLRLLLWSGVQLIYVLTFLLITLAVSLRARSARAALTILLALWAILCIVLPRAASSAAQKLSPIPSYQAVRAHAETEAPAYETAEQWEARRQSILSAFGVTNEQDAPINIRGAQLDQSERDGYVVFDRLLGGFHDEVEAQDRTFGWLSMLTPTVALQSSASAIVGANFRQHRHFIDAAESYRRDLVNRMNGEVMRRHRMHNANIATSRSLWEDTPAFVYQPPALKAVVKNVTIPLLLLCAWCGVAGLAAYRAAQRVQP